MALSPKSCLAAKTSGGLSEFHALLLYLDLSRHRALGLLLLSFRLLSWFLYEGKWFVHSWCVVHMGGKRTGGAGSRTPCRRGALWPVEHCWRRDCSLVTFTVDLAQRPLPSETQGTLAISHWYTFAFDEWGLFYRTFEAAPTFPPMSALFRGCACA